MPNDKTITMIIAGVTLAFNIGMFVMLVKIFTNDLKHVTEDYFGFKEKVIEDLAIIKTKLGINSEKGR